MAQAGRERDEWWYRLLPALLLTAVLGIAIWPGTPAARRVSSAMLGELQAPVTMAITMFVSTEALGALLVATGARAGWKHRRLRNASNDQLDVRWVAWAVNAFWVGARALLLPVMTAGVPSLLLLGAAGVAAGRVAIGVFAVGLAVGAALALHWLSSITRDVDAITAQHRLPATRWRRMVVVGTGFLAAPWITARYSRFGRLGCPSHALTAGEVDTASAPVTGFTTGLVSPSPVVGRGGQGRTTLVSFVVDTNGWPETASVGAIVPGPATTAELRTRVSHLRFRPAWKDGCPVRQTLVAELDEVSRATPMPRPAVQKSSAIAARGSPRAETAAGRR